MSDQPTPFHGGVYSPPQRPDSPPPDTPVKPGKKFKSNTAGLFGKILKNPFARTTGAAIPGLSAEELNDQTNKQSTRRMHLLALAFLFFYILMVGSKSYQDYHASQRAKEAEHLTYAQGVASQVSSEIENAVIWINNGLSLGADPAHASRLIARYPGIELAAIMTQKGEFVASSSRNRALLAKLSSLPRNKKGIEVNSVISDDGIIHPVIIKPTGQYFAVAFLDKNALLDTDTLTGNKIAVVAKSGRVISGDSHLGKAGPQSYFSISKETFDKLADADRTRMLDIGKNKQKASLASVNIPHTNLLLLDAHAKNSDSVIKSNISLFLILFAGTTALILVLLRSLQKQLSLLKNVQKNTEISQQRYRAAVEGNKGGIWEISLKERTAFVSASLASLLGLLRQDQTMPLSDFLNLFHPHDREMFLSNARRAHLQGDFQFDVRTDRLPHILQCSGRSSTRTDIEMQRVIVGVAIDITEQRRAQVNLKIAETRLHNALTSMTDSFAVWDNENKLVLWNPRFQDFFMFPQGSLKPGIDHAEVNYLANAAIEFQQTYQNGQEQWTEYKLRDGRWIRYIESPTSEGGHVSVGTDITENRQREAELEANEQTLRNTVTALKKTQESIIELAERYEQEKIRAEEASQSKSDFLASMSHELRTPLNAINGFSDIMQKEMFGPLGDPRYKEYVKDILFSGQHLLSLINDILDMSKIEAGKMTLNTEVVFLHDMVAQAIRMVRGRASDGELTLIERVEKVREIEADPRYVKQVILNLLTNAIKFTPPGGKVGVDLIEKRSGIIVKVYDTGIGISKENLENLAKPFEQVRDDAAKQSEGTGLGLALSKSLVELHGGNFKITSELGKGTTVMFSLPNKPLVKTAPVEHVDVRREVDRITDNISNILGEAEQVQTKTRPYNPSQAPQTGQAPQTTPPPHAGTVGATAPKDPAQQTPPKDTNRSVA